MKRDFILPIEQLIINAINEETSNIKEWFKDLIDNLCRIPSIIDGEPILYPEEIAEEIRLNLKSQGYIREK